MTIMLVKQLLVLLLLLQTHMLGFFLLPCVMCSLQCWIWCELHLLTLGYMLWIYNLYFIPPPFCLRQKRMEKELIFLAMW